MLCLALQRKKINKPTNQKKINKPEKNKQTRKKQTNQKLNPTMNMFEWEEDNFSFEDSDRFEEVSKDY